MKCLNKHTPLPIASHSSQLKIVILTEIHFEGLVDLVQGLVLQKMPLSDVHLLEPFHFRLLKKSSIGLELHFSNH